MLEAAVRELYRSAPFELLREGGDADDGLSLAGYAAVFDTPTQIDSWEGVFSEVIAPGAFRKTIRERVPVLQFDHGRHPLVGSIPIGVISSLAEDARGLRVEARLTDNWLVEPVRHAIRDGAVDGMSFRFEVVRETWADRDGKALKADEIPRLLWDAGDRGPLTRTLKELRVSELGPVVFPAYRETEVSVRSSDDLSAARRDLGRSVITLRSAPPSGHPDTGDSTTDAPPPGHPSAAPSTSRRAEREARLARVEALTARLRRADHRKVTA